MTDSFAKKAGTLLTLAGIFFPAGGLAISFIMLTLSMPLLLPAWLAAALALLWLAIRNRTYLAARFNRPAALVCAILILSFAARGLAVIAAMAAIAAVIVRWVKRAQYIDDSPAAARPLTDIIFIAAFIALTIIGHAAFRNFLKVATKSPYGCEKISNQCEKIAGGINEPYDIYVYGDNKIVAAYAGLHFIDKNNSRRHRREFGFAVFDYFDPERKILAGGGKGTYTAFIYDLAHEKFLYKKKIHKEDIIDTDYYNGKYYMLCESGNVLTLDEKTHELRTYGNLLLLAYSMKINRRTGKLYMTSWGSGDIVMLDARTMRVENRRRLFSPAFKIGINENANTVLITQPLRSHILEADGNTLQTIRKLDAGLGIRDIQYVPDLETVLGVNFFEGTYTETDYPSGSVIRRVILGMNPRGVYYDPEKKRIFAVSRCGAFEIK